MSELKTKKPVTPRTKKVVDEIVKPKAKISVKYDSSTTMSEKEIDLLIDGIEDLKKSIDKDIKHSKAAFKFSLFLLVIYIAYSVVVAITTNSGVFLPLLTIINILIGFKIGRVYEKANF